MRSEPPAPPGREPRETRSHELARVLAWVLALNAAVAAAKIGFGLSSGAVSILSDGLHSLTDGASNVVALVGIRFGARPADRSHPYGHRKFETLAAGGILVFLTVAVVELLETAVGRLRSGEPPDVGAASFAVMLGTLAVNLGVVRYESLAARRLGSEVLLADSHHTRSDIYTSVAVIAALAGVRLGWPILDPLAALLVAGFIGYAAFQIAREMSDILGDRVVLDDEAIRRVVAGVPEVAGCHEIRTRGSADHAFLDLHVWFRPDMRLDEAHERSHVVKDRLLEAFPQLQDVVIHIEPPPAAPTHARRSFERRLR
jgi:cation diffusion facilitator family transporter